MIEARNTITANSIPDFRNWLQAGTHCNLSVQHISSL